MRRPRRMVRAATDAGPRWGEVLGDEVRAVPGFGGASTDEVLGPLDELELLAPAVPTKVICVGRNYVAHAAEHGVEVPERPLLFMKPPSAVIGPGAAVLRPPESDRVEHEGELAVVISRRGRRITAEAAWEHVLGITCGNDVTARDLQRADGQWTRGKGFDTFCPLGPWLVTGVGPEDVRDLAVTVRVSGEERQSGRTSQMVFSVGDLVAAASAVMTLEPGDVLLTGTPAGVGPLRAGDVVDVEIQGIGILSNPVEDEG